jgi:hypothetical protein
MKRSGSPVVYDGKSRPCYGITSSSSTSSSISSAIYSASSSTSADCLSSTCIDLLSVICSFLPDSDKFKLFGCNNRLYQDTEKVLKQSGLSSIYHSTSYGTVLATYDRFDFCCIGKEYKKCQEEKLIIRQPFGAFVHEYIANPKLKKLLQPNIRKLVVSTIFPPELNTLLGFSKLAELAIQMNRLPQVHELQCPSTLKALYLSVQNGGSRNHLNEGLEHLYIGERMGFNEAHFSALPSSLKSLGLGGRICVDL